MCRVNKICSHCGEIGQGQINYDNGWEYECLRCGWIAPLKDEEIPQGIDRKQYEGVSLKSSMEAHCEYNTGHGMHPPHRIGYKRNE